MEIFAGHFLLMTKEKQGTFEIAAAVSHDKPSLFINSVMMLQCYCTYAKMGGSVTNKVYDKMAAQPLYKGSAVHMGRV